jgi:RNA polymerase sigma-70 factor (sigma-E family)
VGTRPFATGTETDKVPDEFATVFAAHHRGVLRLAYVLTGDAGLAEEVAADVFTSMYVSWQRGRIEDPGAYLRRAVVNRVNSAFRRREVRRRPQRTQPRQLAAAADAGVDDREAVQRALLQLPVRQRAAVALRYLEDLSESQTADALGVSTGTVKAQVSRGLDRLREILEANDEGEAS